MKDIMDFKLQSDSLKEFLPCWLDAQKEISVGITKDTKAFNFKYSTLDQMQEFGEPILNKHSLALSMSRFPFDGNYYLMTKIFHTKSEQFIASYSYLYPLSLTTINQKAQADLGGILSYQARYDLRTILCLPCKCEDVDDRKHEDIPAPQPQRQQQEGCINKEQASEIFKAAGYNVERAKAVAQKFGAKVSWAIREDDFESALQYAEELTNQGK